MRWGTGLRVWLALSGWGLAFGVIAAVLVLGLPTLEGRFATVFVGVVTGAVVGAVLGSVLGAPVALLVALTAHRGRGAVRWMAVGLYVLVAGAAAAVGLVADLPESLGLLRLLTIPVLVTLPFAAARVHRTVGRAVEQEESPA